jgi:hypothetical protein
MHENFVLHVLSGARHSSSAQIGIELSAALLSEVVFSFLFCLSFFKSLTEDSVPRRTGWAEAEATSRRINVKKEVWFIIVAKFGVYYTGELILQQKLVCLLVSDVNNDCASCVLRRGEVKEVQKSIANLCVVCAFSCKMKHAADPLHRHLPPTTHQPSVQHNHKTHEYHPFYSIPTRTKARSWSQCHIVLA